VTPCERSPGCAAAPAYGPTGSAAGCTYRGVLRGAAIGLAVLILVFLDQPSGFTVLLVGVLLVLCLVVIQFFDQPVSGDPAAGAAA
jgi:hypothetical protein